MNNKNKLKIKRSLRFSGSLISYVMLAPFLFFFLLFTVIPVITGIIVSFTDFNMLSFPSFVGFNNYIRLLVEDSEFIKSLKNTLVFSFVCGPIGYFLAFLLAWVINELPKKLRVFMTLVFYAPSISGNIYFIWQFIFSGDAYGLINGFLMGRGLINEPILWLTDTSYAMAVVIIVQLWTSMGVSFLAFVAGFQSVDTTQFEAAAIDGVHNRFEELWYVTIPNMKDMLLFGAVTQIANTFMVGSITDALTGGYLSVDGSTLTIVNHMNDYGSVRYEMGYACAISVVLFIIVYLSKRLIFRLLKW